MSLVTPGIGLLFWMLLSFTIILVILKKFAWRPILSMLKERENKIETALNQARIAKEESEQIKDENKKLMDEAKKDREKLLREAKDTADKFIAQAKEQSVLDQKKMMDEAKIIIENEKKAALSDIRNQIAAYSLQIAEKVIKKQLSGNPQQVEYVDTLLKEMSVN